MEVWRQLREKWKSSPQEVVLIAICAVIVIVGVCATISLRKKKVSTVQLVVNEKESSNCSLCTMKRSLVGLVGWCRQQESGRKDAAVECLDLQGTAPSVQHLVGGGGGSPISPVWQRRIMMGERCEMPRFSGLILYDERGRPVGSCNPNHLHLCNQVNTVATPITPTTTTSRDLL